jgi:tartrate dehydratase alpha subunit/fumarate hydratase class I-like protein
MRPIEAADISAAVAEMFREANYAPATTLWQPCKRRGEAETSPAGREVIETILKIARTAAASGVPLARTAAPPWSFWKSGRT